MLLVQVKGFNDGICSKLSLFGNVQIVSNTMMIYGVETDLQHIDEIQNISNVICVENDYKGYLCNKGSE